MTSRIKKKSKAAGKTNDEVHVLLEKALRKEGRDDLADILQKCREPVEITCLCCSDRGIVNRGCKKRWCPVCAGKVVARRWSRVGCIVNRMQWPLSVMLSIKNTREIAGSVKKLKLAFKGFRRTRFWRDNVKGGFVGFEMTHNGDGCHIHMHVLCDCRWLAIATPEPSRHLSRESKARLCQLAQLELSAAWAGYLGQAVAYVWVRRADKRALAETLKYPCKPRDLLDLKCRISDVIDEIDAGRMVAAFGHCSANAAAFIGRDDIPPPARLCKRCKGYKSVYPAKVISGWMNSPSGPPPAAREAMKYEWTEEHGLMHEDHHARIDTGEWVTKTEAEHYCTAKLLLEQEGWDIPW